MSASGDLGGRRQPLQDKLQAAIELELSTIPPYFSSWASIRPGSNLASVNIIRSVMIEEMLHMLLAGNVLTAIGGTFRTGAQHVPRYPLEITFEGKRFRKRAFPIRLAPFSPESILTFKRIELPEGWSPLVPELADEVEEDEIHGYTIGEFYAGIQQELAESCHEFGEGTVFCGDRAHQLDLQYYWHGGGVPTVVDDLRTANAAIDTIRDQGEGARDTLDDGDQRYFGQSFEVAHFFRFNEIAAGRRYHRDDRPHDEPSGEEFPVDYASAYPTTIDPTPDDYAPGSVLADLNGHFNATYSLMLRQIAEGMSGNPKVVYTAVRNGMVELSQTARRMAALPIPDDPDGRHGAPSFDWVEPPR